MSGPESLNSMPCLHSILAKILGAQRLAVDKAMQIDQRHTINSEGEAAIFGSAPESQGEGGRTLGRNARAPASRASKSL